ncbi:MAG: hypothetical protein M3033_11420 [Acidobacteriota bacterium]|nr:hypothetical protein [Acidobacteriota bacterium]
MEKIKGRLKKSFWLGSLFVLFLVFGSSNVQAQETVDKTVATISDGFSTELITFSDLLWQLALIPNAQLNPPTSEDLNRALQLLINQRLFALEADRVPRAAASQADVDAEIKRVVALFPSTAEFEKRLRIVGFDSVKDDNFEHMMRQRVSIEKYLDFRFRSFVVITPEDEAKYYRDVYTPDFRRRNPGLLMPTLDQKREDIRNFLTEQKVAADIEKFLDDAKRRSEIVILSEV